jgi:transcriptional adapter 3
VPPLGKHYAVKWAKEDLEAEIKENGRLKIDTNGQSTPTTTVSGKRKINDLDDNHFFGLMDDAKKYQSDSDFDNQVPNSQQFGPLTQRLISALIEQNLMTPFDTDVSSMNDLKTASKAPQHMSPRTLSKQFKNQTSLEWNIKKELLEQGTCSNPCFCIPAQISKLQIFLFFQRTFG